MNIRDAIEKLVNRVNLSEDETITVMNEIMTGDATPLQVASFLTALRMKGETVEEITGAAPEGTRKVLLISPLPAPLWWLERGSVLPSMVTARYRANREAPMFWEL